MKARSRSPSPKAQTLAPQPQAWRREPHWRAPAVAFWAIPPLWRPWLLDQASLTQRLLDKCPRRFRVELLSQRYARPLLSEARALGVAPGVQALVRQVRLLCGDEPWVYARTVIPHATLSGANRRLRRLGTRSLGAFLFADPTMRRGALEIACLRAPHLLFAPATRGIAPPAEIWGRRSVFNLRGRALLVNEFFLPALGEFPR